MPTGPNKGQNRPAEAVGNAVKVMRIATEEEPGDYGSALKKNEGAAAMGRKGGVARAKAMTPCCHNSRATLERGSRRSPLSPIWPASHRRGAGNPFDRIPDGRVA